MLGKSTIMAPTHMHAIELKNCSNVIISNLHGKEYLVCCVRLVVDIFFSTTLSSTVDHVIPVGFHGKHCIHIFQCQNITIRDCDIEGKDEITEKIKKKMVR